MKVLLKYLGTVAVIAGVGGFGYSLGKSGYQGEINRATEHIGGIERAVNDGSVVRQVNSDTLAQQLGYVIKTVPLDKTIESVYKTFTAEEIKIGAKKASVRMESEGFATNDIAK